MVRRLNPDIVRFVLEEVDACPSDIGSVVADRFGVTRATASNYLRRLVRDGRLTAEGRTKGRRYALKRLTQVQGIAQIRAGSEDDEIWQGRIRPKLEGLSEAHKAICQFGFTTAVANALDHSGGESFVWRLERDSKAVELMVHDDGMGVFAKLAGALGLDDEARALLELGKGSLQLDPRHSGRSLWSAARMFDRFNLTSHHIGLVCEWDGRGRWRVRVERPAEPVPGTAVTMRLHSAARRTAGDMFAAQDGQGGPGAQVPVALALLGEDALMSRAQARRLMTGLERYAVVTLDFTGVDQVGPAFAHEVFEAFAAAHPQVRLVRLNTSAEVERVLVGTLGAAAERSLAPILRLPRRSRSLSFGR